MAHHYDKRAVTVKWTIGGGAHRGELELAPVPERRLKEGLPYDRGQPLLFLKNIYISPTCRGKGWADILMKAATRFADRAGVDLWLYVEPFGPRPRRPSSSLRALYRRHGFRLYPHGVYVDEMVRRCRATK